MLSCYQNVFDHVAIRLSDEGARLKSGRVAATTTGEHEENRFSRRLVLSVVDWVGEHMACARDSIMKRILTTMELLHSVGDKVHDIVSDKSVLENSFSALDSLFRP